MKLERTSDGWKAFVRIRNPQGKAVDRRAYGKTKQECLANAERIKAEIRSGTPIPARSLTVTVCTFSELIAAYKEKKGPMSPSHTAKINRLEKELGAAHLNGFADRFEAWLRLERQVSKNKDGAIVRRGSSPAKGNRFIEIVRAAFNVGVAMGIIERNPITKERFPKQREVARDAEITPEQEEALLKVVDTERPHLSQIIRFALRVPARKSELVKLRVEDVDLFNMRIRIRNARSKTQRGTFKPIPPEMVEYFRTLPKDTEYVFFRRDKKGKALPLGDFKKAWQYCLKKAEISGMRFHDSRHISATRLIDNGTPAQAVQAIAGWSTDMLKVYYAREPGHALEQVRWGDNKKQASRSRLDDESKTSRNMPKTA